MIIQNQNLPVKTIEIENIGTISLKKSRRCKRLRITLKAGEPVKVSIPYRLSFNEGEHFVFSKLNWVKKHLKAFGFLEKKQTIFNENTVFKTNQRAFKLIYTTHNKIRMRITNNFIIVECPSAIDINSLNNQYIIKRGIVEAMRIEAKKILPERVKMLAQKYGFNYRKISIRNAKTRWGSCSANNNINLNLHLVRLPDELINYVILHELVHTQYKNHGKYFWGKIEEIIINSKNKSQALKQYSIDIF
jgi:hypothetical protein